MVITIAAARSAIVDHESYCDNGDNTPSLRNFCEQIKRSLLLRRTEHKHHQSRLASGAKGNPVRLRLEINMVALDRNVKRYGIGILSIFYLHGLFKPHLVLALTCCDANSRLTMLAWRRSHSEATTFAFFGAEVQRRTGCVT